MQDQRWSKELEATTRVLAAAHDAQLRRASEADSWERRGLLQRLRRVDPLRIAAT